MLHKSKVITNTSDKAPFQHYLAIRCPNEQKQRKVPLRHQKTYFNIVLSSYGIKPKYHVVSVVRKESWGLHDTKGTSRPSVLAFFVILQCVQDTDKQGNHMCGPSPKEKHKTKVTVQHKTSKYHVSPKCKFVPCLMLKECN